MKYFTPELLLRFASPDDEVFAKAHDEWEQAIQRYQRRLAKIQDAFPQDWQRWREQQVCLQDAQLLSMGRQNDTFVMVLQLQPPSRRLVLLTFTLDEEPVIGATALAGHSTPGPITWMYEEFDVDRRHHCWFEVLLSSGWTVRFRFHDFQFLIAERLVLDSTNSIEPAAGRPATPQSA